MSLLDLLAAWEGTLTEEEYAAAIYDYLRHLPAPRPVLDVPTRGLL